MASASVTSRATSSGRSRAYFRLFRFSIAAFAIDHAAIRGIAGLFLQFMPRRFLMGRAFLHAPAGKLHTLPAHQVAILVHQQHGSITHDRDDHGRAVRMYVMVLARPSRRQLEGVPLVRPVRIPEHGRFRELLPGFERHSTSSFPHPPSGCVSNSEAIRPTVHSASASPAPPKMPQ